MWIRPAIVALITLSAAFADAQERSLDIVGIRPGMSFDSARTRIAVHNPALPASAPFRAPLPNIAGGPVVTGYLTRKGNLPDLVSEEIKFDVSLPPSKAVVTAIARTVLYKPESRPTYDVMLDALRKKYGTHDFSNFRGSHYWRFDANGRPIRPDASCALGVAHNAGPDRVVSMGLRVSLTDATAHDRIAALCGQYVRVQLGLDLMNPEIVNGFDIVLEHAPLRATAHHLTVEHLTKLENQHKAQERDAAKKRDPKCCR